MCWMGTGGQVHSTPDIWWVEIKENLTLRKNKIFCFVHSLYNMIIMNEVCVFKNPEHK